MSEKTEKPTARRLREARKKGEVHKSKDVTSAMVFLAIVTVLSFQAASLLKSTDDMFSWLEYDLSRSVLADGEGDRAEPLLSLLRRAGGVLVSALTPLVVVSAGTAILTMYLQVRSVFAFDPIKPKPERLNPATNLKNLFSSKTLITLGKTFLQVLLIGGALLLLLNGRLADFSTAGGASPPQLLHFLATSLQRLCFGVFGIYAFMAAFDYGHQYYEYIKQQRMSKDEVRREYKDVEGDPYIRSHRKALHRALSQESGLRNANVVVTNPTHIAVALRYVRGDGGLPTVVAKGSGRAAALIREQAQKLGIPLVENKPLARLLFERVPLDKAIEADYLPAVARLFAVLPRPPLSSSAPHRDRV